MQVFSVLTYGFTGIADFTFCGLHRRNILMPDGTPSPLFGPAARTHAEVRNIGKTLRFLTSSSIAFLPGSAESRTPPHLEDWAPGVGGDTNITSAMVIGGDEHRNGLIGHFVDDDGQVYFMVTNLYQHADGSAAECAIDVRMTFVPGVKAVLRLSRGTGEVERLEIKDVGGGLHLRLPGGTGDLFKYDTGPFTGLAQ
jgi:hypothetical protein